MSQQEGSSSGYFWDVDDQQRQPSAVNVSGNRRTSRIAESLGVPALGLGLSNSGSSSSQQQQQQFSPRLASGIKQRNSFLQANTPSVNGDEEQPTTTTTRRSMASRDSPRNSSFEMSRNPAVRNATSASASASSSAHHSPTFGRFGGYGSERSGEVGSSDDNRVHRNDDDARGADDEDEDEFLETVSREQQQLLDHPAKHASPYSTPNIGSNGGAFQGSPYADGGTHSASSSPFAEKKRKQQHRKKNSASILEMLPSVIGGGGGSDRDRSNGAGGLHPPASPRLGATIGSIGRQGVVGSWRDYLAGRQRLHPWALLPAFLLGTFLAMSGLFGRSSSSKHIVIPHLPRPTFVSHSSGHIFMDQTRTTLGMIEEHPIHALIRNATEKWEALLASQAENLEEAAQHYRARYNRHPPRGFDAWYKFASERGVILIDEYDQIQRDIMPFLALPPHILHQRIEELEKNEFTHTFVVRNGEITITGSKKEMGRANDQAGLMKNFMHLLPDVNITMSAHDGPSIVLDWDMRQRHMHYAVRNQKMSPEEAEQVNDDPAIWGWQLACPPDSRLRNASNGLEIGALPVGPSFVQDHLATMDLCKNPEWQYMHGFTAWAGPRPTVLQPLFSFAKTNMHGDLLCVPLEQFVNTPTRDPEWEDKPHSKLIWRGSMTGVWYDRVNFWRLSQRSRLHFLSQARDGSRFVRFTSISKDGKRERVKEKEIGLAELNERYLDAGYVGKLHQCTPEDGGCEAIPAQPEMKTVDAMDWESQNDYKYIIDTDGNAWSGRFHRLMASNSLVFKSTIFPEWYSDRIMPWVHYVPLKIDYTDIYDLMAFFSGDMDGNGAHDELARKIAYAGKEWTQKHWRYEDMEAYAFRLYLEWARLTSWDQTNVDYLGPGE